MEPVHLAWAHGFLRAIPTGAMITDLAFRLSGGVDFAPFAHRHWSPDDPALGHLPAHLRHLGAEFVCLPFGVGGEVEGIAAPWQGLGLERCNVPAHGFAANAEWTLAERSATRLCFTLDYPGDHAVRRLTRVLAVQPHAPALDLTLTVEARRAGRVSLGLHPILSLDAPPESVHLRAAFRHGLTYPAAVPGAAMLAAIGGEFGSLAAVPARDGGMVDLSRLPKARPVEDVVLLCDLNGPVEIDFPARAATLMLDWDRRLLPSCQLWISDRALHDAPWAGRYRGLGVEPVASCFDFAEAVSLGDNPVRAGGTATSLAIDPERPVEIAYRLSARPLGEVQKVADRPPSTSRTCPVT
ncbi:hypothetical protein FHS55_003181 [Angulomicrobium tetraedrale]|uniref:Aldose 1-epimerase n=1 Tax=Ancylobacter tetraedralis TaxID=217068 RepID=A0A839ZCK8_9HYPH|nr:hypothetical protein [Ancylobacter tetraedralis]MBB3772560.1 hypothetical protein [Ancylobacter tetraedralis]